MKFFLEELNRKFEICSKRLFREIVDVLKMNHYSEAPDY